MELKHLPHDHGTHAEEMIANLPNMEQSAKISDMFKLISDPSRLRIFLFLCHCEECVSDISAAMEMSDPAVSHHLKLMKNCGLITSRRDGKEVYYTLADNEQAQLLHHACEEMLQITCPIAGR